MADPAQRRISLLVSVSAALEKLPGRTMLDVLDSAGVPIPPKGTFNGHFDLASARLKYASAEQLAIIAEGLGTGTPTAPSVPLVPQPTPSGPTPELTPKVILEKEQQQLLSELVEASRNVAVEARQKFQAVAPLNGADRIEHPGFPNGQSKAYRGDWEILLSERLIQGAARSDGAIIRFDVTPLGFAYYREMKSLGGNSMADAVSDAGRFIEDEEFAALHPVAYERWRHAHSDLWSADSEKKLTDIGHKCREAMQQFADGLIQQLGLAAPHSDIAKEQSRILAVADALGAGVGEGERALLKAQASYWKATSDMVQRQEHGGQKADPLVWEDGRRVVFQSAVVMYEFHRVADRYQC